MIPLRMSAYQNIQAYKLVVFGLREVLHIMFTDSATSLSDIE
jgi:hypothetical protein